MIEKHEIQPFFVKGEFMKITPLLHKDKDPPLDGR